MPTRSPVDSADLTVAFVHGAFADSSGWNGVIEQLEANGIRTTAIPNPLRGVAEDSAYVASAISQIPGPVLAVAHSYGGVVITNAARDTDNVVGLVYVAAFAPDEGETLLGIESDSKDSVLTSALKESHYPTAQGTQTEFTIAPDKFHDAFASDIPVKTSAVMAATQRPVSALAFSEPSGPPAWKKLPSWSVVATGDRAAGSDVVRSMAKRAQATTVEVEGSHVVMISKPDAVRDVVMQAVNALSN
jgi:pimeloyl-ACP methyl ester carboxylesterase